MAGGQPPGVRCGLVAGHLSVGDPAFEIRPVHELCPDCLIVGASPA